jgi:hypothetical protein
MRAADEVSGERRVSTANRPCLAARRVGQPVNADRPCSPDFHRRRNRARDQTDGTAAP